MGLLAEVPKCATKGQEAAVLNVLLEKYVDHANKTEEAAAIETAQAVGMMAEEFCHSGDFAEALVSWWSKLEAAWANDGGAAGIVQYLFFMVLLAIARQPKHTIFCEKQTSRWLAYAWKVEANSLFNNSIPWHQCGTCYILAQWVSKGPSPARFLGYFLQDSRQSGMLWLKELHQRVKVITAGSYRSVDEVAKYLRQASLVLNSVSVAFTMDRFPINPYDLFHRGIKIVNVSLEWLGKEIAKEGGERLGSVGGALQKIIDYVYQILVWRAGYQATSRIMKTTFLQGLISCAPANPYMEKDSEGRAYFLVVIAMLHSSLVYDDVLMSTGRALQRINVEEKRKNIELGKLKEAWTEFETTIVERLIWRACARKCNLDAGMAQSCAKVRGKKRICLFCNQKQLTNGNTVLHYQRRKRRRNVQVREVQPCSVLQLLMRKKALGRRPSR